jgi:hypothetical protein
MELLAGRYIAAPAGHNSDHRFGGLPLGYRESYFTVRSNKPTWLKLVLRSSTQVKELRDAVDPIIMTGNAVCQKL